MPQPRNRDSMLAKIRANYESTAKKAGETTAYPGDWLYDTWSSKESTALFVLLSKANCFAESDLKAWLEEYGFDVPHTNKVGSPPDRPRARQETDCSQRDKLVGAVRRNSRLAWLKKQDAKGTASESVRNAFADLKDSVLDTWSDSQIKEFCDKNGINGTSCPFRLHPSLPPSARHLSPLA